MDHTGGILVWVHPEFNIQYPALIDSKIIYRNYNEDLLNYTGLACKVVKAKRPLFISWIYVKW